MNGQPDAYKQGKHARSHGHSERSNPYLYNEKEWHEWLDGYYS